MGVSAVADDDRDSLLVATRVDETSADANLKRAENVAVDSLAVVRYAIWLCVKTPMVAVR